MMNVKPQQYQRNTQNIKAKRDSANRMRFVIQAFFFFGAPAIFTTSFSGVEYIVKQFAGHEVIEINSFIKALVAMLLYTIIFGRFICGYACSFGSLQDWLFSLVSQAMKKLKKKRTVLPARAVHALQIIKYIVLIAVIFSIFMGIHEKLISISPWTAFSQIIGRQFQFAGLGLSIVVMILVLLGSCIQQRFFCQFLCPMGAIFSFMPVLPISQVKRDRNQCIKNCSACEKNCPARLQLDEHVKLGECISCNKCVTSCPIQNIGQHESKQINGNEWWLVTMKALILYGLFYVSTNL